MSPTRLLVSDIMLAWLTNFMVKPYPILGAKSLCTPFINLLVCVDRCGFDADYLAHTN